MYLADLVGERRRSQDDYYQGMRRRLASIRGNVSPDTLSITARVIASTGCCRNRSRYTPTSHRRENDSKQARTQGLEGQYIMASLLEYLFIY